MKLSKIKIKINAVEIGDDFLYDNKSLTHFEANKLKTVSKGFLLYHPKRKEFCKLL